MAATHPSTRASTISSYPNIHRRRYYATDCSPPPKRKASTWTKQWCYTARRFVVGLFSYPLNSLNSSSAQSDRALGCCVHCLQNCTQLLSLQLNYLSTPATDSCFVIWLDQAYAVVHCAVFNLCLMPFHIVSM